MKAEPKKSKTTGKGYTVDVVDPLASGGKFKILVNTYILLFFFSFLFSYVMLEHVKEWPSH